MRTDSEKTGRSHRAGGFTLVELMVAVAVISILCVLTLPAVQSAREASRRIACLNNLRQIALGMQSYVGITGKFPPIDSQTRVGSNEKLFSAHVFSVQARILDCLERVNEYNSINFAPIPTTAQGLLVNLTAMSCHVDQFVCPSDEKSPVVGYGRSNYRFSVGTTHRFAPGGGVPESKLGAFTVHYAYGPADFSDGLANTIGISERLQGDWTKGMFKANGDYLLVQTDQDSVRTTDTAVSICAAASDAGAHESRGGESWFFSGFHFTNYNHCVPPNSRTKGCALDDYTEAEHTRTNHQGVFTASSRHVGGVNASAMDGSVRFVRSSIDPVVWRALGTRSSGDSVTSGEL